MSENSRVFLREGAGAGAGPGFIKRVNVDGLATLLHLFEILRFCAQINLHAICYRVQNRPLTIQNMTGFFAKIHGKFERFACLLVFAVYKQAPSMDIGCSYVL